VARDTCTDVPRCDSTEHALHQCNKPVDPENPTPFATCYVCLGVGHLSSLCPQNHKGVYVNGGSCKVCGSVAHRAKDCPDDKRGSGPGAADREEMSAYKAGLAIGMGAGGGADDDDFLVTSREVNRMTQNQAKSKGKRGPHEPAKNGHRGPAKMTALPPRDPPKVPIAAAPSAAPAGASEPVAAAAIIRRAAGGPKPKPKVVKF
jgi:zinc finger CCHC domain-containing protein 9